MKEQIETLVRLYRIETETLGIKQTLFDLSGKMDAMDLRVRDLEEKVAGDSSVLDDLKKNYRSYETDSQTHLSQIKKSQEKLTAVKTNKEYQAILKEIDDLKEKNSQIEDKMISCLDQMETAEKVISRKRNEFSSFKEEADDEKERLKRQTEQERKRLAELEKEWENISQNIAPDLFETYMKVRERVGTPAMAPADEAVCLGCHLNIPPQLYNEIQRFDSLKFCPHCQRILFWEHKDKEKRPE